MNKILLALFSAAAVSATAGEIFNLYYGRSGVKPGGFSNSSFQSNSLSFVSPTNNEITQIGIERCGCFGYCPIYTFIIKNDGTCHYNGEKYVQRIGEYTGKIPVSNFQQAAKFLEHSGFMRFKTNYEERATDQEEIFTMAVKGGKQKIVRVYGEAGPSSLNKIEQMIDGLSNKVAWDNSLKPKDGKD